MEDIIEIGALYRHYKGNIYRVKYIATHSEDLSKLVIYESVKETGKIWARPAYMWNEEIVQDGVTKKRFEKIEDNIN